VNELQKIFNYEGKQVRTVMIDGEPMFVAKDVCEILEISNPTDAVSRLDDDERTLVSIEGASNGLPVNGVTETGLYSLVLGSRKPEAKSFKRWITHEVLPSIRKHGAYMTPDTLENMIASPEFGIKLLSALRDERDKNKQLTAAREADKPKVLFADSVSASHTSILVGDLAKIIKQNGVDVGQNRLFEMLRGQGYLMKEGSSRNMPTQRAMESKLFEVKESSINNPDGSIRITKTTKVTGKGQVYFVNKFCGVEEDTRP